MDVSAWLGSRCVLSELLIGQITEDSLASSTLKTIFSCKVKGGRINWTTFEAYCVQTPCMTLLVSLGMWAVLPSS